MMPEPVAERSRLLWLWLWLCVGFGFGVELSLIDGGCAEMGVDRDRDRGSRLAC